MSAIWIVGRGGMGRETLCIYHDARREADVAGFLEENCRQPGMLVNGKPVHDWSTLASLPRSARLIVGIGNIERERLIDAAAGLGFNFDTAIHPSVKRSPWVTIDQGCIVCANCVLTTQIEIGAHTIINLASTISHDVTIGRFVTISSGVHVSGRVTIEDRAFIGAGAVIIERIRIGAGAIIGAGAVVTKDVPPGVVAVGVPARIVNHRK